MKAVIFSILVAALSPAIACAGLDAKSLAAIRRIGRTVMPLPIAVRRSTTARFAWR